MTTDVLRTQSSDVDFHRSRRMFCIREGKITVAPEGTAMSHLEWFEAEGWISKDNVHEFLDSTIRGIFLPARHALFLYPGSRRLGCGREAVASIWRRFPGPWELQVHARNAVALRFWASCVAASGEAPPDVREIEAEDGQRIQFDFYVTDRITRL